MLKKITVSAMIFVVLFTFVGCSTNQSEEVNITPNPSTQTEEKQTPATRTVTDMAGRTVTIPQEINRIYATHSIGTLFVYTLAPDKVAGWNYELGSDKAFIKEAYHNLPVLGRWKGTNASNMEEILKVKPDIIVNMGDTTEKYVTESNEIEKILGIPVIMIDGSLAKQGEAYAFLGNILNREERAKQLADYSANVYNHILEKAKTIKDENKVSVYYGAGMNGLETVPANSINSEVLDLVGGINIAKPETNANIRRMEVSLEQLINWNPNLIILSSNSSHNPELYHHILHDASWSHLDAVESKEVYEIPYGPYDWFSQPPTLLRIMGLQWLGDLLYPEIYQIDIKEETKAFFKLFFDLEMTDEEVNQLLKNSVRNNE